MKMTHGVATDGERKRRITVQYITKHLNEKVTQNGSCFARYCQWEPIKELQICLKSYCLL